MPTTVAPSDTTRPAPARRRRLRLIVLGVAVLVLFGGIAAVYVGGDAPDAVGIEGAVAGLDDASPDRGESGDTAVAATSADGTWTVTTEIEPYDLAASTGSFVGYRIDEELANIGTTQAVGRTPAVDGEITVAGTSVSDATVTGELSALESDQPRRDGRVAEALEAAEHPTVRFTAEPFALPSALDDGARVEVDVPGTLEAAGGATDVVATMTAQREGEVVVVTGSLDVALADLEITAPSAAVVLSVADTATIEWQLYLTRA